MIIATAESEESHLLWNKLARIIDKTVKNL